MRRALVDFDAGLWFGMPSENVWNGGLERLLDALRVYGMKVVGSAAAPEGTVRLIVEGDTLPAECDEGWRIVRPTLTNEHHGSQNIVRVTDLPVTGRPAIQIAG